jgi:hypothetical protein
MTDDERKAEIRKNLELFASLGRGRPDGLGTALRLARADILWLLSMHDRLAEGAAIERARADRLAAALREVLTDLETIDKTGRWARSLRSVAEARAALAAPAGGEGDS